MTTDIVCQEPDMAVSASQISVSGGAVKIPSLSPAASVSPPFAPIFSNLNGNGTVSPPISSNENAENNSAFKIVAKSPGEREGKKC